MSGSPTTTSTITVPLDLSGSAALIRGLWQKNVQNFVEIGQELARVKDLVGHGYFIKWVREGGQLPFKSEDTAERLMRVAENAVLSNPAHARNLPACLSTLDELTKLPETLLKTYLAAGKITADMERTDAAKLRPKKEKKGKRPLGLAGRRRLAEKLLSAAVTTVAALGKAELDSQVPEFSHLPEWLDQLGSAVLTLEKKRDRVQELLDAQEEARAATPGPPTFAIDNMPAPGEASL